MGLAFSLIALAAAGLGIAAATGAFAPDQQIQTVKATDILNDATQVINNYCSISCGDNISNTNVVVTGSDTRINLSQTCSAVGAECSIKNIIGNQIDNMITDLSKNEQKGSATGIMGMLGPTSTENEFMSTAIKNSITQLVNNTCSISVENQMNNVRAVIVGNNDTFNIAQTGDMDKSTCAMDTVIKNVINNNVANTTDNKQSTISILQFLIIAAAIVILVLVFPILSRFLPSGKTTPECCK
jgi:hypothetical protein